jgi:hypothetical protein
MIGGLLYNTDIIGYIMPNCTLSRHCEERSDEAIQKLAICLSKAFGLLRFARNDVNVKPNGQFWITAKGGSL